MSINQLEMDFNLSLLQIYGGDFFYLRIGGITIIVLVSARYSYILNPHFYTQTTHVRKTSVFTVQ